MAITVTVTEIAEVTYYSTVARGAPVALKVPALIENLFLQLDRREGSNRSWTCALSYGCSGNVSHPTYVSADGAKCRRTLIHDHSLPGGLCCRARSPHFWSSPSAQCCAAMTGVFVRGPSLNNSSNELGMDSRHCKRGAAHWVRRQRRSSRRNKGIMENAMSGRQRPRTIIYYRRARRYRLSVHWPDPDRSAVPL
jgi:hypothetical protein